MIVNFWNSFLNFTTTAESGVFFPYVSRISHAKKTLGFDDIES